MNLLIHKKGIQKKSYKQTLNGKYKIAKQSYLTKASSHRSKCCYPSMQSFALHSCTFAFNAKLGFAYNKKGAEVFSSQRLLAALQSKALHRSVANLDLELCSKSRFATHRTLTLGLVEHNNEKSTKFVNFLQFLVYKELSNSAKKEKTKGTHSFQMKGLESAAMQSKALHRSVANLDLEPSQLFALQKSRQGSALLKYLRPTTMNFKKSITQKKADLNSFFPYSKTWICYWLLPFMGFISYLSFNIAKDNYGFTGQNPSVIEPQFQFDFSPKDYSQHSLEVGVRRPPPCKLLAERKAIQGPSTPAHQQKMDKNTNNFPVVFKDYIGGQSQTIQALNSYTSNAKKSIAFKQITILNSFGGRGQTKNDSNNWTLIGSSSIEGFQSNTSNMVNSQTFTEFYNLWYPNYLKQKKNFGFCSNLGFQSAFLKYPRSTFDFNQKAEDPLLVSFSKNLSHKSAFADLHINKNTSLKNTKYLTSIDLSKTFVPISLGATNLFVVQNAAINNTIYPDKFYTVPTGKIVFFPNQKSNSFQSLDFSKNTNIQSQSSLFNCFIPLSKNRIVKSNTNMRKVNRFLTSLSAYGVSLPENRSDALQDFATQKKVLLGISTKSIKIKTLFGEPFDWNNQKKKLIEKSKNTKTTTQHNSFYKSALGRKDLRPLSNQNEKQHFEYVLKEKKKENTFPNLSIFEPLTHIQNKELNLKAEVFSSQRQLLRSNTFNKNQRFLLNQNPLFSYKKASLLMDEFLKEMKLFKEMKTLVTTNPSNSSTLDSLLVPVLKKENFQIYFPKYYNKILKKNTLLNNVQDTNLILSFNKKVSFPYNVSIGHGSFNLQQKIGNGFNIPKEVLSRQYFYKKTAFLEKMIYSLSKEKDHNWVSQKTGGGPRTLYSFKHSLKLTGRGSIFLNADFQQTLTNKSNKNTSLLKQLSKEQFYSIVLNSFTKSLDSFFNEKDSFLKNTEKSDNNLLAWETNQNSAQKESKRGSANAYSSQATLIMQSSALDNQKNSVFQLNHPLMFANVEQKSSPFNTNQSNSSITTNQKLPSNKANVHFWLGGSQHSQTFTQKQKNAINSNQVSFSSDLNKGAEVFSSQRRLTAFNHRDNSWFNNFKSQKQGSFFIRNSDLEPVVSRVVVKPQMETLKTEYFSKYIQFLFQKLNNFCTFSASAFADLRFTKQRVEKATKKQRYHKNSFVSGTNLSKVFRSNTFNKKQSFLLKNNTKENKIEKIFRSYLSKKRKYFQIYSGAEHNNRSLKNELFNNNYSLKNISNNKTNNSIFSKNKKLFGVDPQLKEKTRYTLGKIAFLHKQGSFQNKKLFELSKFSKNERNELKEMKQTTINSFFKNRAFLLKSTSKENENQNLSSNVTVKKQHSEKTNLSNNGSYFEKLEKRKYAQKKHRRKKQRKETRRRKKRKRFYPRPSWVRYKLYNNYLKRSLGSQLGRGSANADLQEALGSSKTFHVSRKDISLNSSLVYKSAYLIKKDPRSTLNTVSMQSLDKTTKTSGKDKAFFSHSIYVPKKKVNRTISNNSNGCLENLPLYSTKDFYQIKTSVLGELKRSFWKSYWLRSNLKPYLTHIKQDLKELKESSTNTTHSFNYKNLISFLSGLQFKSNNFPQSLTSDSWKGVLTKVHNRPSESELLESAYADPQSPKLESSYISKSAFKKIDPRLSLANKPYISWTSINSTVYGKPNYSQVQGFLGYDEKTENYKPNKWQLITQIYEHNRIMYERMQNLILNIRENVNLSGQIKPRPYKRMGHQKLKSFFSLKQNNPNNPNNNDFWVKLGKNRVLRSLFQSSYKYYGDFSKYRLYWAIHKSNLGSFKTTNKVKSIWMSTKNRDQRKANKTKKILYDLSMKYNSFLNHSTILSKKLKLGETNNLIWKRNLANNLSVLGPSIAFSKAKSLQVSAYSNSTLRKNFVNNKFDITLPLNVSKSAFADLRSIEKTLEIGERKLKQKQQKLRIGVGTTVSNQVLGRISNTIKGGQGSFFIRNTDYNPPFKDFNQYGNENKPLIPGYVQKFTNEINYWWNESKINQIPSFRSVGFFNSFSMDFPGLLNKSDSLVSNTKVPLWVSIFLFHFCAFLSLISISQIRDFIKFTLIVTSKISKVYFNLISLSLNSFENFLKKIKPTTNSKLGRDFETSISTSFISYNSILGFSNNNKSLFNLLGSHPIKEKTIAEVFSSQRRLLSGVNNNNGSNNPMNLFSKNASFSKTFYYMFVSFLKKPFLLFLPFASQEQSLTQLKEKQQKTNQNGKEDNLSSWNGELARGSANADSNKTITKRGSIFLNADYRMAKAISKVILYSSMTSLVFSLKNFSFLTYSYFVKSLNFIETFIRSVYTFFEKPGELIIDWMAYLFLVEWSSDFTNTIPDTVDTSISNSIQKFSRSLRFSLFFSYLSNSSTLSLNPLAVPTFNLQVSSQRSLTFDLSFSLLGGSLIQRRILSMYEIFVNIACRPDTDLSVRQQKGKVFWDLWSDLFIQVAEDSNINVSELSNLKEEQNRLLEKLVITFNEPNNLLEGTLFNKITSFSSENKKSPYTTRSLTQQRFSFFTNSFRSNTFQKNNGGLLPLSLSLNDNNLVQFGNSPIWKHWSTNQFLSYQGKDTELFIDLHPPKSLTHLTSLKYSQSIQQPIGLILCQIFSGIFYKQIAKNLLVVGPSSSEKSLLIQAIAGETEFKIITDNAYRYAMVFRGVAVGIKLLRDVFEALTLHTPCIFLLEDIHAIGERRPFLISDDENTKGTESSFSTERDEVHEKNQVVYQLTKHIISHYKKPYKGDFSLLIPTNHFCFDLFNSVAPNEKRSRVNLTPLSPISLVDKSTSDMALNKMEQNNSNSTTGNKSSWEQGSANADANKGVSNFQKTKLSSSLQLKKNQLLAPPATSPFSVLVLKEEKKLKPKKIVKEFPWAGLPGEQFLNVSKATYSIRVKVALLADMVLSNLSVKLDMITDLLVIIDSVKGNRGFVVFATTHVPYILDPALRRPGRFDETLSLPQIPSLLSRWEILKSNLSLWQNPTFLGNRSTSLFTNPSLLNYGEPLSVFPLGVSVSLWQSHILKDFMLEKGGFVFNHQNKRLNTGNSLLSKKFKLLKKSTSYFAENKSLDSLQTFRLFKEPLSVQKKHNTKSKFNQTPSLTRTINKNNKANQGLAMYGGKRPTLKVQRSANADFKKEIVGRSGGQQMRTHTVKLQKVSNIVSKVLLSLQYCLKSSFPDFRLPNKTTFNNNKTWGDFSFSIGTANTITGEFSNNSTFGLTIHRVISLDSLVYMSLYSSPHIFKQHLTILMAGQIGQTFFQNSNLTKNTAGQRSLTNKNGIEPCFNQTWKTATSLVFSFIQKRWIYQKNLILPKFLDFGTEGYKTEIPSPPSSNILLPAKRYENMKRTFTFSQLKQKTQLSIGEKIQLHQQQRLVKRLYKIPLKEYFKSEILNTFTNNSINESAYADLRSQNLSKLSKNQQTIENTINPNNFTSFSNASIILAPFEKKLSKTTSMNWYFRNRILNRHHTYLSNQWWNGQLQEHNTESTFLSDIDWRYSYFMTQSKDGSMGDLFIDFPDAEQYYNPKNQRWINTSGSWNSWFDFDKAVYEQYASHYISECFSNAYQFLDQNRELLDFYVITVFEKGMEPSKDLDELTILEILKRFSGLS